MVMRGLVEEVMRPLKMFCVAYILSVVVDTFTSRPGLPGCESTFVESTVYLV